MKDTLRILTCLTLLAVGDLIFAQEEAQPQPEQPEITVAVLGFQAADPKDELGQQIGEVLSLYLSAEPGFRTLDRQNLQTTLSEQELNLTGLVDTDQAIKVGRLVGAKILVVGRAFELGNSRILTAKLIGTETTLIEGVVVRDSVDKPMDEMVLALAEQAAAKLRESGAKLIASDGPIDPLPALIAKLKGRELPVCAVVVFEDHLARRESREPVPDPAVETELKKLLIDAGVTVKDVPVNELATWARQGQWANTSAWPQSLEGVELVITGEAFSESAGSIGNLRTAIARAEINVVSRADGRIVLADRATRRAVDLADNIAGKTALQKTSRDLAVALLTYLDHATQPNPQAP